MKRNMDTLILKESIWSYPITDPHKTSLCCHQAFFMERVMHLKRALWGAFKSTFILWITAVEHSSACHSKYSSGCAPHQFNTSVVVQCEMMPRLPKARFKMGKMWKKMSIPMVYFFIFQATCCIKVGNFNVGLGFSSQDNSCSLALNLNSFCFRSNASFKSCSTKYVKRVRIHFFFPAHTPTSDCRLKCVCTHRPALLCCLSFTDSRHKVSRL